MPAISASAPGKIILLGEHAVVYGQPAIAVPLPALKARAVVTAEPRFPSGQVRIMAPAIDLESNLNDLPAGHPLRLAVESTATAAGVKRMPAFSLRITSTIPVASGLGSGAAVSVAVIRAVSAFLGRPLPDETVSALAFEVEKIYHGTPSGIDNTVITYALPVVFRRGQPPQPFHPARGLTLLVGDTGVPSSTAETVGDVRKRWQADPPGMEAIFARIGEIVLSAQVALEGGDLERLGALMDENQRWLAQIGVSSAELDRLVEAARQAGAAGAKLSGGGGGGNMLALVAPQQADMVAEALRSVGARQVLKSALGPQT